VERKGKVELAERIRRHGHRPAIFVLTGQRALAESLERELVERGFETAVVHRSEVPSSSRRAFLSALWNLGMVVISWAETSIRLRDRRLLAGIAGDSFFDLSSEEDRGVADVDWSEVIRLAEGLRSSTSEGER
jgi:hypothetical protein